MSKFKYFIWFLMLSAVIIVATGCGGTTTVNVNSGESSESVEDSNVELKLVARFYDNSGKMWFEAYGKSFDLKPNKVKEYGYNSDGDWTYYYNMSSVVSCSIDGHPVDTCGSTAIFKDASLEPCGVDFNEIVKGEPLDSNSESSSIDIDSTSSLDVETYFKIKYWWLTHIENGNTPMSRLVVIQSQDGSPIEMYMGNKVSWTVSSLPKTTLINIDGKELYLHRSNFAIIDTALLPTM